MSPRSRFGLITLLWLAFLWAWPLLADPVSGTAAVCWLTLFLAVAAGPDSRSDCMT